MTALSIQVPFPVFQDRDGQPLDNGYVWIGTANLNPQTNPVVAYFDSALTIVAAQPLRTLNGYISNAGTPAQIYVDGVNFSILVQDSKGSMVYNFPDGTGLDANAEGVIYYPAGTGAVTTNVQAKLRQSISVKDFGAVGDGVANDTASFVAALLAAATASSTSGAAELVIPAGNYKIATGASLPLVVAANVKVRGAGMNNTILAMPAATNPASVVFVQLNSGGEVSDLTLSYASNACHGIQSAVTVSNVAVRRVKFIATGSNAKAIWIRSGTNVWVEDCFVDNQSGTPDIGIYLQTCIYGCVTGNTVLYTQQLGGASAIRADACSFTHLDGNTVVGGNITHLAGGSHGTLDHNSIKTSSGDSGFGATWPDLYKHGTMIGNTCSGSTDYCFSLTACQYMTVTGNAARNASTGGIGFVDVSYATITGNVANNNGQQDFITGGTSVQNGIIIFESGAGRSKGNIVIGNITIDDQGTNTQQQGINIVGADTQNTVALNQSFNNVLSQIVTTSTDLVFGNKTSGSTKEDFSGTWIPTLAFGGAAVGITYTVQTGTYTRVGNLMTVRGRLTLTSKGSSTGAATIGGLPVNGAASLLGTFTISYATGFASGIAAGFTGYPSAGNIQLQKFDAGATTNMLNTDFTNTSDVIFTMQYEAA